MQLIRAKNTQLVSERKTFADVVRSKGTLGRPQVQIVSFSCNFQEKIIMDK